MAELEKKYEIKATSADSFYRALTDENMVSQWSGAPAVMSEEEGAHFSLWGGSIVGINKSVSQHQLSQQWKEKSWPDYSEVKFEWTETLGNVEVKLIHRQIPEEALQNIHRGWDEHYMIPLITWLESNNF